MLVRMNVEDRYLTDCFDLSDELVEQGLDESPGEEYKPVETTIGWLGDKGAGTACGSVGNQCFIVLAANRALSVLKVRGWFAEVPQLKEEVCNMNGMVYIECDSEVLAEAISEWAGELGSGSLRSNGPSPYDGYWEFEVE